MTPEQLFESLEEGWDWLGCDWNGHWHVFTQEPEWRDDREWACVSAPGSQYDCLPACIIIEYDVAKDGPAPLFRRSYK